MSFIGPRPGAANNEEELIVLREQYNPSVFEVKPGRHDIIWAIKEYKHLKNQKWKNDIFLADLLK